MCFFWCLIDFRSFLLRSRYSLISFTRRTFEDSRSYRSPRPRSLPPAVPPFPRTHSFHPICVARLIPVLVLIDHFLFFRYFSSFPPPRAHMYDRFSTIHHTTARSDVEIPSFGQVAAFFGICVWLVPFGLFVSLSAGELVLPTMGSDGSVSTMLPQGGDTRHQGMVKQVFAAVGGWVQDTGLALGWTAAGGRYAGRYR